MTRADESRLPSPARMLSLGDSYTIGESVSSDDRWPIHLAALLRARGVAVADPTIIARTGWTTRDLGAALDEARPRGPFGLVTLLVGVNDQYRGRPAAEYRPQFRLVLSRAVGYAGRRADAVIVLSIPDWGVTPQAQGRDRRHISAEIDAYNAANRAETAAVGANYVDVTPISRLAATNPALLAADGLHPSAAMYVEWARAVLPIALGILAH